MAKTWVLVANQAGARIFDHPVAGAELALVEEIDHPEGRLKNSEIDTDRAGAAFESAAPGVRAMGREESAHERVAADFARALAAKLSAARNDGRFDQLLIVADPHLLGLLRRAMDVPTGSRVKRAMPKNLAHVPTHAMHKHLASVLDVAPPQRYH
jgi:protein required for attachment to host cells